MSTIHVNKRNWLSTLLAVLMFFSLFFVPAKASEGIQETLLDESLTVSLRVEGSANTIYWNEVEIEEGDTVLNVLDKSGIYYEVEDVYGFKYIKTIDTDEEGQFGVWDGWQYMVNDIKPWDAVDQYVVQADDEIYFYYGNIGDIYKGNIQADEVSKLTLIPEIEIIPTQPIAGQGIEVTVTASYDVYDEGFDYEDTIVTTIAGATVHFNGQNYVTNANGIATIPAADVLSGSYVLKVSKEVVGSYPRLVRTEAAIDID